MQDNIEQEIAQQLGTMVLEIIKLQKITAQQQARIDELENQESTDGSD